MDNMMKAMCGTYCGICEWKDKMNCQGCKSCSSRIFWGECKVAKCCMERGFEHCGFCKELPCQMLIDAYHDPEHGDNGARLQNLKNWVNGKDTYEKIR